ncbi:WD domain-containing protein [Zalerion maritima]|uniref:WD domain-containing protein n=1 Tax=Zalerion maritima TaxID=339359 RepID=A0AAD5RSX7_9PEZI|nr:WD domain-containing protein [Zalerion maritima]
MSMITSSAWVPRGYATPFPAKQEFDEDEYDRIAALAQLQIDDAKEDLQDAKAEEGSKPKSNSGAGTKSTSATEKDKDQLAFLLPFILYYFKTFLYNVTNQVDRVEADDDDLKEYDLEHYDDDDDEAEEGQPMGMFGNIKSLAYHQSNEDDPYITLKDTKEEDDEEREELQILGTDNLLLATKVEDDVSHLEVYVYEDDADNLYTHHDIMLPAIPLCVEWLDISINKSGVEKDSRANFVAIGTMDPDIEVWDLDTVDSMFPNAILGEGGNPEEKTKKKKKKKRAKKANDEYHIDAVLSLAANRKHRNLLASASADKTVKLWDLHTAKCAKSYTYHTDKVCSLAWHSVESTVLLSGSYDRTVVAADMRAPDAKAPRWGVESDVENVRWDPHDRNLFYVSTENGIVHCYDARNPPSDPAKAQGVWRLQAHDDAVSCLDINPSIPGYMATGSADRTVKLWNIQESGPGMVVSRDLDVGKVFSATFAPDSEVAFRLAVAGSQGVMQVWDTSTNVAVRKAFANRIPASSSDNSEDKLIKVEESDTDSDSEEGEDAGADSDEDAMDED